MASKSGFYSLPEWKALRAKTKRLWIAEGKPCGYCGEQLLASQRLVVDHIKTVRKRPDLALSPSNLSVLHHVCHNKKTKFVDYNNKVGTDHQGFPPGWQD